MITKPVPALPCTPTGHYPTSRTTPELATALTIEYFEFGDVETAPDEVYPRAPMSVVSDYLADIANSPAPD